MSEAWKKLDLEGGGLQSANLRLAALLRKRPKAYLLLALFPLGLHRDYLRDRRGAWLYRCATLACAGFYIAGHPQISLAGIAILAACAVYEAFRIDDAVAKINKQLRMQVYLSQAPGTPRGFKGHYTDDSPGESPQAGTPESAAQSEYAAAADPRKPRMASFAEQEKMLRELAEIRRKPRK